MQKEVVGKQEQKVQHYMGLKLTLHMIYTLILSSIILNQQIHTMKLCTKSISANSTISHLELFWHTILAGEQNDNSQPFLPYSVNTFLIFHLSFGKLFDKIADQKVFLQLSRSTLLRCAEQDCQN